MPPAAFAFCNFTRLQGRYSLRRKHTVLHPLGPVPTHKLSRIGVISRALHSHIEYDPTAVNGWGQYPIFYLLNAVYELHQILEG